MSAGANSPCHSAQQHRLGDRGCPTPRPQAAPSRLNTWEPRSCPSLFPLCFLLSPCRDRSVGGQASADCKEMSLVPPPIYWGPTHV